MQTKTCVARFFRGKKKKTSKSRRTRADCSSSFNDRKALVDATLSFHSDSGPAANRRVLKTMWVCGVKMSLANTLCQFLLLFVSCVCLCVWILFRFSAVTKSMTAAGHLCVQPSNVAKKPTPTTLLPYLDDFSSLARCRCDTQLSNIVTTRRLSGRGLVALGFFHNRWVVWRHSNHISLNRGINGAFHNQRFAVVHIKLLQCAAARSTILIFFKKIVFENNQRTSKLRALARLQWLVAHPFA